MTLPVVTALPTAPSRSDVPATFITRADAFVGALATLVTDINAFGTALPAEATAINYNGTSTTSLAIATGSKSLTIETGKLLQVGQFVTIANTPTPANYMYGQVTAYTSGTGALVVNVTAIGGTGTFAAWTISIALSGAAIPTGTGFRHVTSGAEDAASIAETGTGNVVRSASPTLTGTTSVADLNVSAPGAPLYVNSTNSNGLKIAIQDAGVLKGAIGTGASGVVLADSASAPRLEVTTAGAGVTGTLSATGAVSPLALLDISGASAGQIKFPATQNASADVNTLDDYEEGTFTPAVNFGGVTTGITYSTQTGRYTKIGRQVLIEIEIALTSKGAATGSATITGLPFAGTGALFSGSASWMGANLTSVTLGHCIVALGAATLNLYNNAGTGFGALSDSNFQNTTQIYLTATYTV